MKLRTKIFLGVLTIIVIISVAFTVLYLGHQKQAMTNDLEEEGLTLANLASHNARLGVFAENKEFLDNTLTGVSQHRDVVSCGIYSVEGRQLARWGKENVTGPNDRDLMDLVRQTRTTQVRKYQDRFEFMAPVISDRPVQEEELLFYSRPLEQSREELIGFLHITVSTETLLRSYGIIVTRGAVASVLFLIIGGIASFFLARRLTGPLNTLNTGVMSLSAGNIGEQVNVKSNDEIGSLAEAFNAMSLNLVEREKEKARLINELEQSKRIEALGIFAGGISHDFNNILSIIQHNVDLAKLKAPAHVQEYLERAREATRRGGSLVSRLLDFTTEKPQENISINLGLLTKDVIRLFESSETPDRIRLEIKPGLWMVRGDTAQLHRLLVNLITNAQEAIDEAARQDSSYRKDKASISIVLENVAISEVPANNGGEGIQKEYIQITVSDTGCGMDEHTRQHIFEPFFSAKKPHGTGLGLSTAYGTVKQLGGTITVLSERGKGTTFQIRLPRSTEAMLVEEQAEAAQEPGYVGGDETLLLVDDEAHILDAMREALEDMGYTVRTAQSGEGALDVLTAEASVIDLVIMDHLMPGMTGVEVIRKMREQNMRQNVIVYSGSRLDQFKEHLPGVHFVNKPFEMKDLAVKIRNILGSERAVALKDYVKRIGLHIKQEPAPLNLGNISDTYTAYNLFKNIANEPREVFMVLLLDSSNNLIAYEQLTTGTTNESQIYPKEVVRLALLTNATAVILIHNHPSGSLKPSRRDIVLTAAVSQACKILDVQVLEHLIIARDGYTSMSREGYL